MRRLVMFFLSMASFLCMGTAAASEACFVDYHRGFLGDWERTVVQRSGLEGLGFETRTELVRAEWVEPNTKVTKILSGWDGESIRTYTHIYEDTAAVIAIDEEGEVSEERVDPISSTCHRGPSGSLILVLNFTGEFDGIPMEFQNTAEVDDDKTMVVSMMRPLGSDEPFSWHNTLYGVRVNSGK